MVQIVRLENQHVAQAAEVHMCAMPGFFLSFLGAGFLRQFYRSFVGNNEVVALVAVEGEPQAVLGLAVGPLAPAGFFKRLLKRRWPAFCIASMWALVRRPWITPRIMRALTYRGEAPVGAARALLSSLAVDPSAQGRGVGKKLVHAWVEQARQAGAAGCYLTTDAVGNDQVNAFYRGMGWTLESSFTTPQGRQMNRYVLDLPATG